MEAGAAKPTVADTQPATNPIDGWTQARKQGIFASGPRKGRTQFCVSSGTAKSCNSTDSPQKHNGETGFHVHHLEAQAGEDTGSDHGSYHQ